MAGNEYYPTRPHEEQDHSKVAAGSPLAVLGIFLEILRERFSEDAGLGLVWREDAATSDILIELGYNRQVEAATYGRALYVTRVSNVPSQVVVGNRAGVHLPDHKEGFYSLMTMALSIDCVSNDMGECELLGDVVQHLLLASRNIIAGWFGIHDVSMPELGTVAPYKQDQTKFSVPVNIQVTYQVRWSTVKIRPLLQDMSVRLGATSAAVLDAFASTAMASLQRATGTVTQATTGAGLTSIPDGYIVYKMIDPALTDPAATQAGLRTLGPGTQQAAPGTVVGDVQAVQTSAAATQAQLTHIVTAMREPTGFADRTTTTLTFDELTRTLTVAPTASNFEVFVQGTAYTKTGPQSLTWTDVEGIHVFYYETTGTLTHAAGVQLIDVVYSGYATVALVFWDATNKKIVYRADERHGLTMDWATHGYLHLTNGTQWISGLGLSNLVLDGNGTLDTQAELSVEAGEIRDEDLVISSVGLTLPAQLPVLYRTGVNGDWRAKAPTNFPIIHSGTVVGYAGTLPAINQSVGGTWQLTEVTSGRFFLAHIVATNDPTYPVVAVCGLNQYQNLNLARAGALTEADTLALTSIFAEFVIVGSVIFGASSTYTNTPKAVTRTTAEGASYVDFRSRKSLSAAAPTSHENLVGLSEPGAHPASAISLAAIAGMVSTDVQAGIAELKASAGGGKRTDRIIVGISTAGATAQDCDYLDTGNGAGLAAALAAAATDPLGYGEIVIREGAITFDPAQIAANVTIPAGWFVRGMGVGRTKLTLAPGSATRAQDGFALGDRASIKDVSIVVPPCGASTLAGTGGIVNLTGAGHRVKRLDFEFQTGANAYVAPVGVLATATPGVTKDIQIEDITARVTGTGTGASYVYAVGIEYALGAYVAPALPIRVSNVVITGTVECPVCGVYSYIPDIDINGVYLPAYGAAAVVVTAGSVNGMDGTVKGPRIRNVHQRSLGFTTVGGEQVIAVNLAVYGTGNTALAMSQFDVDEVYLYTDNTVYTLSFAVWGYAIANSCALKNGTIRSVHHEGTLAGVGGIRFSTTTPASIASVNIRDAKVGTGDILLATAGAATISDCRVVNSNMRNLTLSGGALITNTIVDGNRGTTFTDGGTMTSYGPTNIFE